MPVIASRTFGDAPFSVSASSKSGGAITYAVTGGSATVDGSTVTVTGTGAVTITAKQAAAGGYAAATASARFLVTKATPTFAITGIPSRIAADTAFTVATTSDSPGEVTYAVFGLGEVSGDSVTLSGKTVMLMAKLAASSDYAGATKYLILTVADSGPTL